MLRIQHHVSIAVRFVLLFVIVSSFLLSPSQLFGRLLNKAYFGFFDGLQRFHFFSQYEVSWVTLQNGVSSSVYTDEDRVSNQ